jgi:hypothetical protein
MLKQIFLAVALLVLYTGSKAQDTTIHGPECGLNGDYMLTMGLDVNNPNIPPGFPGSAIQTCGKFKIYYYDMAYHPGAGFDDASLGATRRSTLCSVLTYIQQTFDFSNIPSGQYIRLRVDTSYTPSYPSVDGSTLIWGAPYFKLPMASGSIVNGFVWDYNSSGTDPAPGSFHGNIQVNFEHYAAKRRYVISPYTWGGIDLPVDFQNGLGTVGHCQFDLFTCLLHATTHTMGFYTMKDVTHGGTWTSSAFTSIDTSIRTSPHPYYSATAFTAPMTKLYPSGLSLSFEWYDNSPAPYRMQGKGSHSAQEYQYGRLCYGDHTNPLMYQHFTEGTFSRTYAKEELRILHNIVGYNQWQHDQPL